MVGSQSVLLSPSRSNIPVLTVTRPIFPLGNFFLISCISPKGHVRRKGNFKDQKISGVVKSKEPREKVIHIRRDRNTHSSDLMLPNALLNHW